MNLTQPVLKFLAIGFMVLTSCAYAEETPAKKSIVRFDGLYQTEKQGVAYGYLRFFEDGSVVSVTSTGTPAQISKWFHPKSSSVSKGKYKITGNKIEFVTESSDGKVVYVGTAKDDELTMNSHSLINDFKQERKYKFVKLEESKK